MEKELWRDVKGYEGLYQISNKGRVKSLERIDYGNRHIKERILKPETDKGGYLRVQLFKDGKGKKFLVHRLLAMAFIPNTDNLPQVNHKDENKTNNFVYINENGTVDLDKSNIEFCTAAYNTNYGTRNKRAGEKQKGKFVSEEIRKKIGAKMTNGKLSKPLLQINKDTNEVIAEFPSVREVQRQLGFSSGSISSCCNGKRKTYKGFKWRLAI